jgi:hypothetical protein
LPVNVTMSQSISVGIGVTSHKAGSLATGTFDNVSITQP